MPDPKYMTFVEHLQELRVRLAKCFGAIIVGSIGGWSLAPRVIHLLDDPLSKALGHNVPIYVDTVYGAFTLNLKVAIIIGFVFALPVTIYQLWAFIAPAFGPGANRWAPIWMASALLLFLGGGAVGYEVIPLALKFFAKFQGGDSRVVILPFASQYLNFFVLILVVFGVSFELPLVLVSLSSAGITSSGWLSSKRLYFFFGIFIFATVVTPGADLISPLILGAILYVLYEISILVSRLLGK
jgi:sec-independent protein translocase protein TatC